MTEPSRATPNRADATLVSVLSGMGIMSLLICGAVFLVGTLPIMGTATHPFLFARDHGRGGGLFALALGTVSFAIASRCFAWKLRIDFPHPLHPRLTSATGAHGAAAILLLALGWLIAPSVAMSRRRRARSSPSRGFDTVRTPFGWRSVPRGQGWAEASKWAMLRLLGQAIFWGGIIALGWVLLAKIASTIHP